MHSLSITMKTMNENTGAHVLYCTGNANEPIPCEEKKIVCEKTK